MKKIGLVFFFLIASFLLADTISEEDIFLYRHSLREKKFSEAQDMLSKFQNLKIDQTKLELLETELWIAKGEDLYTRKQYRSAFPYFSDAYARWRTNPLIRERYTELSGKLLHDEELPKQSVTQKTFKPLIEKEKEIVYLPTNAEAYFIINSFRIGDLEDRNKIIYGIGGSIFTLLLIQVIINLILLIRK